MIDIESIRSAWNARGFSCGLWVDPPGQVWADFSHETDELLMLFEGKIELSLAERTGRPAVGEEIFIPARGSHTVRNVGGVTGRWLYGYRSI
ncbi:MAG: cupin domain-containing protein [Candidatus Competibacter sp.]|nr:cupin domain-containing protein [Candidatus Competibacter sp.]